MSLSRRTASTDSTPLLKRHNRLPNKLCIFRLLVRVAAPRYVHDDLIVTVLLGRRLCDGTVTAS